MCLFQCFLYALQMYNVKKKVLVLPALIFCRIIIIGMTNNDSAFPVFIPFILKGVFRICHALICFQSICELIAY